MTEGLKKQKCSRLRILKFICVAGLAIIVIFGFLGIKRLKNYSAREIMLDVKAGLAARHATNQVDRYLEARYGSMTNAANREKAFLDFFNVDHIKELDLLAHRMSPEQRSTNISAMAEWIARYRETMTPEEKVYLRAQLNSPEGMVRFRQAISQYVQQDVHYRAANAIAISEFLTTLSSL